MNSNKTSLAAVLGLALGFSPVGHAACSSPQTSGIWEVAFSNGSSCRLKVNINGTINVDKSVCYDPDRGVTTPESGLFKPNASCFAEGELVVEGVTVEVPVQYSQERSMAAGRYRISADGSKGSVMMVRVP